MKKNIFKNMENTYAAAAFAEAGEHETAIRMAGINSIANTVAEKAKRFFDLHMTAASFAEAGCFETAAEMMEKQKRPVTQKRATLDEFLNDVGIPSAKVRYVVATV